MMISRNKTLEDNLQLAVQFHPMGHRPVHIVDCRGRSFDASS